MKRLACLIFCLMALLLPVRAEQSVTLAWDPNPESDIGGYIVYYGSASRNYTNAVNAGNVTTNTVRGLVDGAPYFFAVTAYNTNGLESDFSDEVSYATSKGTKPSRIKSLSIHYKQAQVRGCARDCIVPNRRGRLEGSLAA